MCITAFVQNATYFRASKQQNLGRKFGTSKTHLSLPVALADVRSKALLLLIRC